MKNDASLEIRLPQKMLEGLQSRAKAMYTNASTVARMAIGAYLDGPVPTHDESRAQIRQSAAQRSQQRRALR